MCRYALSKVATVTCEASRRPSPKHPTRPAYSARISRSHCSRRTRVGTRHSVLNPVLAIAARATRVFPLPVGKMTSPRLPLRSHAQRAASWYGRSATADQAPGDLIDLDELDAGSENGTSSQNETP